MELVAVNGLLAGTAYLLSQDLIIPSPDDESSPNQLGCRIRALDGGEFTLEAVDGETSLFVNGLPLSGRPLRAGDEVRLGDTLFIARAHEARQPTVLDACPVSLGAPRQRHGQSSKWDSTMPCSTPTKSRGARAGHDLAKLTRAVGR